VTKNFRRIYKVTSMLEIKVSTMLDLNLSTPLEIKELRWPE